MTGTRKQGATSFGEVTPIVLLMKLEGHSFKLKAGF